MKAFVKSIKWIPTIIIMITSFSLALHVGLPEFIMKYIRNTGPGALVIPIFIYSWILSLLVFSRKENLKTITAYAVITTLIPSLLFFGWIIIGWLLIMLMAFIS